MKTPREIIQKTNYKNVLKSLKYFYGGQWTLYGEETFNRIKNAPKRKHRDDEEFLEIDCANDCWDEKEINSWYRISTNKYSLSFRKWDEISNLQIGDEMFNRYKVCEIIAHLIYEMTWYGTEKVALKRGKELLKIADKRRKDYVNRKTKRVSKRISKKV